MRTIYFTLVLAFASNLFASFPILAQGDVPYNLYATDENNRGSIPFEVNWPTQPRGELTSLTVTDKASLRTALATAGARITVAAGSYGTLALKKDDQHWILDDDAVFSGLTTDSGRRSRIIIEGGIINPGKSTSVLLVVDDFLMKNVKIPAIKTLSFGALKQVCHRVAFIHNTVVAQNVAFYTPDASIKGDFVFGSDFIVAANYLQGGMTIGRSGSEPALRIQSVHRAIIVDNRARTGFDDQNTKHTYRSHYGNKNFYMRRNMNEYGDGIYFQPRANRNPILPSNHMGDHWVYDHLNYYNGPGNNGGKPAGIANGLRKDGSITTWPGVLTAVDNTAFRAVQTKPEGARDNQARWYWNKKNGDVIANNSEYPYQDPPPLKDWLTANGLPPGADH